VCIGVDMLVARLLFGGGGPMDVYVKTRDCSSGLHPALPHTWCGLLSSSLMRLAVKLGHFGAAQQSTQGRQHCQRVVVCM
jgi:hypothetical protein